MFLKHTQISPALAADLLQSAGAAARAIPPAFSLDATVAVNPFLGQTGEGLAYAAARLGRVAGISLTQPRGDLAARVVSGEITDDDLAAALITSASPVKPRNLVLLKAQLQTTGAEPKALPTVAGRDAVTQAANAGACGAGEQ